MLLMFHMFISSYPKSTCSHKAFLPVETALKDSWNPPDLFDLRFDAYAGLSVGSKIASLYSLFWYKISTIIGHENSYVTELSNPLNVRSRLKRQWPSDLKDQREEEE
jgi:hypothetical protein